MKTQLMIFGLLVVGVTVGLNAYIIVDCKKEGDPCAYIETETGQKISDNSGMVCTLQPCAYAGGSGNKCFVCAEPKTTDQKVAPRPS